MLTNPNPFVIMTKEVMANTTLTTGDNLLFQGASEFSQFVETEAVRQNRTCTEIVLEYCEDKNLEADAVSKLINGSLRGKIEAEMVESGLLRARNTITEF